MLLGSEFDEFADLLAPAEAGAEAVCRPFNLGGNNATRACLSEDADDAIAALIESAGPVPSAELPELARSIEQASVQAENFLSPDRSSLENAVVPLSLQETGRWDGELSLLLLGRQCWPCRHLPDQPPQADLCHSAQSSTARCTRCGLGTGENDADEARGALRPRAARSRPTCLGSYGSRLSERYVRTREETGLPR